jgi:hypothetical protein
MNAVAFTAYCMGYLAVGAFVAGAVDALCLRARGRRTTLRRWSLWWLAWPAMLAWVAGAIALRRWRRRVVTVDFEALPRCVVVRSGDEDPVLYAYDAEGRLVRHEVGELLRRLRGGVDRHV